MTNDKVVQVLFGLATVDMSTLAIVRQRRSGNVNQHRKTIANACDCLAGNT